MNKNDNGFGSIRQRKDGRWEAHLQVGVLPNGKPDRVSVYGKSETEIKRKLKSLLRTGSESTSEQRKKTTLSEYIVSWLEKFKKNELKASSYDRLETIIKKHIVPFNGNIQLQAITSLDIQEHINTMKAEGYSYSSIKKVYEGYNAALRQALYEDLIKKNPCYAVTLPHRDEIDLKEISILNSDEELIFVNETKRRYGNEKNVYRLGYAFILILNTGIRIGEALALTWEKVDFHKRIIFINANIGLVKNRYKQDDSKNYIMVEGTTKSKSGNRKIPLNDEALEALLELKKITGGYKYVMSTSKNRIITPHSIANTINCIYNHCGIEKRGIHALRHTFASKLFQKNVDVKIISKLLGHNDVNITYNTYIHLIEDHVTEAVALLNASSSPKQQSA